MNLVIKQEYLALAWPTLNTWQDEAYQDNASYYKTNKKHKEPPRMAAPTSYIAKITHFGKYFLEQSIMVISFHF